mmetsp:Transcript_15916/g.20205  ORF Transcript_15916/g.20205 Transcript_15916/m.20205 type:complete len:173 (+) Transcript_15916:111-629(+)
MFPVGRYKVDTVREINSRYDVLRNLQLASLGGSSKENRGRDGNDDDLVFSDPLQPPLEEVLDVVASIPGKELKKLKKKMKPIELCTILKRQPVAQERALPKKAGELLSILLDDPHRSNNPDEQENRRNEYRKVLLELNIMLGKVGAGDVSILKKGNDTERLKSFLNVVHRTI